MKFAEGSAIIEMGDTKVICTATVENKVPAHLAGLGEGWITAEYAMLPRATPHRSMRDSVKGKISGRSHEIQRLIGRSLRAVVDLKRLGERTIILDCDVLHADGGTRTAAITGSFIALVQALKTLFGGKKITGLLVKDFLAGVSVGIVEGTSVLDLCFFEDSQAEVDMNVIMTGSGKFVEVQGTAEHSTFTKSQLDELIQMSQIGIQKLISIQKQILNIESFI